MKNHIWFDSIGWAGAAALLIAYAMVSSKKLEGNSTAYQFLNIVGSLLLAANTIFYRAYPSSFELDLDGNSCFFHRNQKATLFRLD